MVVTGSCNTLTGADGWNEALSQNMYYICKVREKRGMYATGSRNSWQNLCFVDMPRKGGDSNNFAYYIFLAIENVCFSQDQIS